MFALFVIIYEIFVKENNNFTLPLSLFKKAAEMIHTSCFKNL